MEDQPWENTMVYMVLDYVLHKWLPPYMNNIDDCCVQSLFVQSKVIIGNRPYMLRLEKEVLSTKPVFTLKWEPPLNEPPRPPCRAIIQTCIIGSYRMDYIITEDYQLFVYMKLTCL